MYTYVVVNVDKKSFEFSLVYPATESRNRMCLRHISDILIVFYRLLLLIVRVSGRREILEPAVEYIA